MAKKTKLGKTKSTSLVNTPARTSSDVRPATPTRTTRSSVTNPRPRGNPFVYSKHGRGRGWGPKNDLTIKPEALVDLVRPGWNAATGMTVRIWPCFDYRIEDEDVFCHSRGESMNPFDYNDWVRTYPACSYVGLGDDRLTFIAMDPREGEPDRSHPYLALRSAIYQATEEGDARLGNRVVLTNQWFPLTNRESKLFAFPGIKQMGFMQGGIYFQDNKLLYSTSHLPRGLGKNDRPQFIQVSGTAVDSLIEQLNEQADPPGDGDQYYKYPDLTSLSEGFWVTFYNPDKHPATDLGAVNQISEEEEEEAVEEETTSSGKKRKEFNSWKVRLSPTFRYSRNGSQFPARRNLSEHEGRIREQLRWFDNVIHVPALEETCAILARCYRRMPDLLRFGWREHPEYFTTEVKGILAARVSGPGAEVPALADEEEPAVSPRRGQASSALPDDATLDANEQRMLSAAVAAAQRRAGNSPTKQVEPTREANLPLKKKKKKKKLRKA